jgi:4-aminobutyrate--pyruvate transaminase
VLSNLATRDVETLIHPYTQLAAFREAGPLILERGEGVWVYDTDGKSYLEGMAGLWCTALGYSNAELVEAAREQMGRLPFTHLFSGRSHDPAIELAEKLKEIAPVPISKVFFCSSGSEANDTQVKLVWYMNNALGRPGKKKIISRLKGYHGVTIASASLTGLPANHVDFDLPIQGILHTSCPHHYRFAEAGESEADFSARLAAELEELILREGPDTVAAFIAEPVMGAGGAIMPPRATSRRSRRCSTSTTSSPSPTKSSAASGRLGDWFGSPVLGFRPDTISFAKAVTSAYLPLGGVMIPEAMYQAMLDESRKIGTFGHGFTYSGPSRRGGRRGQGAGDLQPRPHRGARAGEDAALPGPALGARRPSARRRGPRDRAHRRPGDRGRQGDQAPVRPEARVAANAWPSRKGKG